jgi:hypothetical protein
MAALVGVYGEPLQAGLAADDLPGVARTLRRAGSLDRAIAVADAAVQRSSSPEALRARAEIAKVRGDRARALADFEAVAATVDDPTVRLELAKLYEHWKKEPSVALEWAARGTGETDDRHERRVRRLTRKAEPGHSVLGRRKRLVEDPDGLFDVGLRDHERRSDT